LSTAIENSPGAAIQPPHSRPRLLPTGGHRISPLEPVRRSGVAEAVGRSYSAASASSHGQLVDGGDIPACAITKASRPPDGLLGKVRFAGDPHAELDAWRNGRRYELADLT